MSNSLREEFNVRNFGLQYPDANVFVRSAWPFPRLAYLLWRLFWCLWQVVWVIISGVRLHDEVDGASEGAKWFTSLSNLTFLLTTVTCLLDFLIVLYVILTRRGLVHGEEDVVKSSATPQSTTSETSVGAAVQQISIADTDDILFRGEFTLVDGIKEATTPWFLQLLWSLYGVMNTCNVLNTITFWPMEHDGSTNADIIVFNGINIFFVVSNILISAMPVRLLHAVYPMIAAVVFFIFTLIYYLAGGTAIDGSHLIFQAIDWEKAFPTAFTICFCLIFAIPLVHLAFFALFTFREFLSVKRNVFEITTPASRDAYATNVPSTHNAEEINTEL